MGWPHYKHGGLCTGKRALLPNPEEIRSTERPKSIWEGTAGTTEERYCTLKLKNMENWKEILRKDPQGALMMKDYLG